MAEEKPNQNEFMKIQRYHKAFKEYRIRICRQKKWKIFQFRIQSNYNRAVNKLSNDTDYRYETQLQLYT